MKIELCVPDVPAYNIARNVFAQSKDFEVRNTSITNANAAFMASPGNSFGEMNGGVDGIINTHLSSNLTNYRRDTLVKDAICKSYAGELPVGSAVVVHVPYHPKQNYLIYAPTMRVAEELPQESINAYLAMRAVLVAYEQKFKSRNAVIACPLFCTGAGAMPVERACRQMLEAHNTFMNMSLVGGDWQTFHNHHRSLLSL